jgi:hypothetical protein
MEKWSIRDLVTTIANAMAAAITPTPTPVSFDASIIPPVVTHQQQEEKDYSSNTIRGELVVVRIEEQQQPLEDAKSGDDCEEI